MTKIKICGLFRSCDIDYVNEAKPDYCGFIINFPKSHRNLTPEQVRTLRERMDSAVSPVGVFVDEAPETVAALLKEGTISVAQLHGHEDENYIAALRALAPGCTIWKAFKSAQRRILRRRWPPRRIWSCWTAARGPARPSTGLWRRGWSGPSFWPADSRRRTSPKPLKASIPSVWTCPAGWRRTSGKTEKRSWRRWPPRERNEAYVQRTIRHPRRAVHPRDTDERGDRTGGSL